MEDAIGGVLGTSISTLELEDAAVSWKKASANLKQRKPFSSLGQTHGEKPTSRLAGQPMTRLRTAKGHSVFV
mgnify:CR=1 FL=1